VSTAFAGMPVALTGDGPVPAARPVAVEGIAFAGMPVALASDGPVPAACPVAVEGEGAS
jgi:hypothetical protein